MQKELKVGIAVITCAIIALVIVLVVFLNPFAIVQAGERGVVLNWGAFTGSVMEPGLHLRVPVAQRVVKINVQTKKLEVENSEAYSKDLQLVNIHSALNYSVDARRAGNLYQDIGIDYENKIVRPALEASVKEIIARYNAEELLNMRGKVQDEIEASVRARIEPQNMTVLHYSLVNEDFSDNYEAAIEQKQVAEQNALKAENDLKRVQFEADQRVAQAKAEAEAIRIQAEAITSQGGADYVMLKTIEQWNGVLPSQMISGATLPFLNITK